jgi:hypothetical protein
VTVSASAAHALSTGAPSAWAQAEWTPAAGAVAKLRVDAAGVGLATVEYAATPALTLMVAGVSTGRASPGEAAVCPIGSLSAGAELKARYFSAQASTERISRRTTASLVLGAPSLALPFACGLSCAYDDDNHSFAARAARLGYAPRHGAYALAAFVADTGAPKTASYGLSVHALAPASGWEVATELATSARDGVALATAVGLALGGGDVGKARVGTDGLLHLSYKTRVEPTTTLTLAAALDLNRPAASARFGLTLALAP